MKKFIIYAPLFVGLICLHASAEYITVGGKEVWAGYADAKVTLKVVDQDGVPVPNAIVDAGLVSSYYKDFRMPFLGPTDSNGHFVIEGFTMGRLTYMIKKDGYYYSRGKHDFSESAPPGRQAVIKGRWQPWNQTQEVILKEKKNPIPMYAKSVKSELPEEGVALGYDLLEGDWVGPYGKGSISDFIFRVTRYREGKIIDVDMFVNFSNPGDGIQLFTIPPEDGSEFKFPYLAPVDGYKDELVLQMGRRADGSYYGFDFSDKGPTNYIFRIRRMQNGDGLEINTFYGKIRGPILVQGAGRDTMNLIFTYYLNPTANDRNMEFDKNRNLFRNLTRDEDMIGGP